MKRQWSWFAAGLLSAALFMGMIENATAAPRQEQVTLDYSGIQITLNDIPIVPLDVNGNIIEPFSLKGTTYLPVRGIASALGLQVGWDQDTQTIRLTSGTSDTQPQFPIPAPTPTPAPVQTPIAQPDPVVSRTVYITRTGKHYHYDGSCNGGTYIPSTLDEAIRRGLTPCDKCT